MKNIILPIVALGITIGLKAQITELPNGNVGIGTSNPSEKLDLSRTISYNSVNQNGIKLGNLNETSVNNNKSHSFIFKTLGDANGIRLSIIQQKSGIQNDLEILSIKNDNIGIGTTNPLEKLDLSRTISYNSVNQNGIKLGNLNEASVNNNKSHSFIFKTLGDANGIRLSIIQQKSGIQNDLEVLSIKNDNIGIGTTNPSEKLDLSRTISYNSVNQNGIKLGNLNETSVNNNKSHSFIFKTLGDANGIRLSIIQQKSGIQNDLEVLSIKNDNIGIGTTDTKGFKLGVNGKVVATEVKVATYSNWADFVFKKDYKLPTLSDVENHIKEKGHLKDIPSAKEVEKDGFFLGEMDAKLLQKIEELTLYTIQQEKKIKSLEKDKSKNEKQQKEIENQQKKIERLESLVEKLLKDKN